MKTVQDKDGNIIEVADDTPCHAGINGALPVMLDEVLDADIFAEMTAREAEYEAEKPIRLKALAKSLRDEILATPITINGMEILTDQSTRSALSETIQFLTALGSNAPETIQWKAENGFFPVSLSDITNIGIAAAVYVQKGFAIESTLVDEITSGTLTTEAEVRARSTELLGS